MQLPSDAQPIHLERMQTQTVTVPHPVSAHTITVPQNTSLVVMATDVTTAAWLCCPEVVFIASNDLLTLIIILLCCYHRHSLFVSHLTLSFSLTA